MTTDRHDLFAAAALTGLAAIYVEAAKSNRFGWHLPVPQSVITENELITGIARTAHKLADAMEETEATT